MFGKIRGKKHINFMNCLVSPLNIFFCSSIAAIFFPLKIAYSSSYYYLSSFVWLFSLELMIIFFPWFVFVFRSYFSFHRHSGPFLFGWSAMIIWNFALILFSLSLFICSFFSPTKNKKICIQHFCTSHANLYRFDHLFIEHDDTVESCYGHQNPSIRNTIFDSHL